MGLMDDITEEATTETSMQLRIQISTELLKGKGFSRVMKELLSTQPVYYDENGYWWLWNKTQFKWTYVDETQILLAIRDGMELLGDVTVKKKRELLEALKQESRRACPEPWNTNWVQFKDKVFDITTKKIFPVESKYFGSNPIPWTIGKTNSTPESDTLFASWVEKKYVKTLYEIVAYCCIQDYPIHMAFCLEGGGRNGKGRFVKLIERLVGKENTTSGDLASLSSGKNRFQTFNLFKKLVCTMGETNWEALRNTSMFKQLTGEDTILFEAKNKTPFNGSNYAKILISTNNLPTSYDTSDGFYSRWLIIPFPNQFREGECPISKLPDEFFNRLAKKVVEILPELLERFAFTNQGTIEDRKKMFLRTSNPITDFLKERYEYFPDGKVHYTSFFAHYKRWLTIHKKRQISSHELKESLIQEGLDVDKMRLDEYDNPQWAINGLREKSLTDIEKSLRDDVLLKDVFLMWVYSGVKHERSFDEIAKEHTTIVLQDYLTDGRVVEQRAGFVRLGK